MGKDFTSMTAYETVPNPLTIVANIYEDVAQATESSSVATV
jgi:hypothetical protein